MRTAFLFPGQGSYLPGLLSDLLPDFPDARATLDDIDRTCAESGHPAVSRLLTDPQAPTLDDLVVQRSAELDLALVAGALTVARILREATSGPDVVVGHSVGEISALAIAGALTVTDAVRVVAARTAALRGPTAPAGGMTAVSVGERRAEHLVGLIDSPSLVLATDNGPDQCVVSGTEADLAAVRRVAEAAEVRSVRLRAAAPFHNPMLRDAATALARTCAEIPMSAPALPVYSPILGRYVRTTEDVRAVVDRHLLQPVRFYDALLRLHHDGVRRYVESGGREILAGLVRTGLPAGVQTVAPLRQRCTSAEFRAQLGATAPEPDPARVAPAAHVRAARPESPAAPENLIGRLRTVYAEVLGYPAELLDDDVDLEADLGIDSIKQIEAFRTARQRLGIAEPPPDLRITSYTTLVELAEVLRDLADGNGHRRTTEVGR
ncbi:acyltransferase domain-containing protein [Nocardia wallacei]|uniref:acyltransferase domain-containing protein n=1 Tax=Nocardia wallacei TaxID=480035 RepID=UPI0024570E56|nr:acyltransferase domain-containing protein [Nocardia wallacei]